MHTARRIINNMLSLTLAEIMSKGINFLTVAYLARVITPEGYGILGIINSYLAYFIFAGSLGFDIIGTRELARIRNRKLKVVKPQSSDVIGVDFQTPDPKSQFPSQEVESVEGGYVNTVVTIRFLLGSISFLALLVVIFFLEQPIEIKIIWLIAGCNIFTNVFLLNWFFQAIERMEIIAIRQIVTGVLNLAGVLLFVHSIDDLALAMVITVAAMAINTGWMLLYYIKKYDKIKLKFDVEVWKPLFKPSLAVGATFIMVLVYNNLNMNMLAFLRTNYESGLFSAAQKVVLLVILPTLIYQQALFPNFSRMEGLAERRSIMDKYSRMMFLTGSFISFSFIIFSSQITKIIYGVKYAESAPILAILMVTAFVQYISITYSSPLIAWKKERNVMYSTALGGIVNIILNIILIPRYGTIGAAIGTIFSESAVAASLAYSFYKTINSLFIVNLIKISLIAAVSAAIAYILLYYNFGTVLAASLCIVSYILINLLFKTVTISELRWYFRK